MARVGLDGLESQRRLATQTDVRARHDRARDPGLSGAGQYGTMARVIWVLLAKKENYRLAV
jgi:hypothetical protein